jgi:hypothetical protein
MIGMTMVLLLLGGALVVYLSTQNGDDRRNWDIWERELSESRKHPKEDVTDV